MRIDDSNPLSPLGAYKSTQKVGTAKDVPSRDERSSDKIEISAEAQEMLEATAVDDTEQAQRLEALRQSIAEGSYAIPYEALAQRMLSFWRGGLNGS